MPLPPPAYSGKRIKLMKKVLVDNLPDNSYISQPVYLDEKFIILSPEIPVQEDLKKRLKDWEYQEVFTDGIQVHSLDLETAAAGDGTSAPASNLETSIKEKSLQDKAQKFYLTISQRVTDLFERFKIKGDIKIGDVTEIVKTLNAELKENRENLLHQQESLEQSDYVVNHSIRTALLSLALADFLKLPPHKQIDIGIAALLHRLGMLKIPAQIYTSNKPLTAQERKIILAHPILSYKLLQGNNFPLPITLAVLEHQERIDGSGYPRHITGDKISLYGKIIAVASSYTAAVSKRPFKTGLDGHSGIMDLLKDIGKRYDDKILKALVYTLSIYPIGTYVALSNGTQGIVMKTNPENPKFPIVKLLINEKGSVYPEKPILHTNEGDVVQITRPLGPLEIGILKQKLG